MLSSGFTTTENSMNVSNPPAQSAVTLCTLAAAAFLLLSPHLAPAQDSAQHDGQRDFDFLVGSWKIHLKRLVQPEHGAKEWVDLDGTVVCRQIFDGRGEFYDQDVVNGGFVFTRFVWTATTTRSPHFEQSISADGGKSWELNWATDQTKD